jgi:phenylalanyl-tRNA synthetase beta chain
VRTNFNHQQRNIRLFELGKVFATTANEDSLPKEQELFALALSGGETLENKAMTVREFDFYDAKGALETAIDAINLPELEFAAKDVKHLRKGQSAEIRAGGKAVGTIGRLSDEIASVYKFRQPVFVAEIDLQTLLQGKQKDILYRPLSVYPSIQRDVSVLVKRNVSFAQIKQTVEAQGFELLRKVEFVDVYEGKGMADDERSITIRLEYRSDERTLTEAEAEVVHAQILQALERDSGSKQRF